MKVKIYPVYSNYRNNWLTVLKDEKENKKIIEGNNPGETYLPLYLTALLEGLKKIKYPVDIIIYTPFKRVEVIINEKHFKSNNYIDNHKLWRKIKKELDKHKSVKSIRTRFIDDKTYYKIYKYFKEKNSR
ncbi:MAG: hypothetical protein ACOCP8_09595 [archaeon]